MDVSAQAHDKMLRVARTIGGRVAPLARAAVFAAYKVPRRALLGKLAVAPGARRAMAVSAAGGPNILVLYSV